MKMASRISVSLAALLVTVAAAEGVARLFLTSPSVQVFDKDLGYVNRPNSEHFQSREGFQALRLNELGLNDGPIGSPKPGQRVLFIGDSMTFAAQVPAKANFTSWVEKLDGVDAVNGGRDALGPHQWPLQIQRLAPAVKPSLTVIVMSRGDAFDLRDAHARIIRDAQGKPTGVTSAVGSKDALQAHIEPLMKSSALITYMARRVALLTSTLQQSESWLGRLMRRGSPPADARNSSGETLPPEVGQTLADIMRVVRLQGPVLVVSLPSFRYLPDGQSAYEPRSMAEAALFRRAAQEAGVPYLDLTAAMQSAYARDGHPLTGFSTSKMGEGHLNQHGHEVVGRAMAAPIQTLIRNQEAH